MKVMLIRPGALGDTLMLMPSIRQMTPEEIILVGRLPGLGFLEPFVERCINYEGPGWHRLHQDETDNFSPLPFPPVDLVAAFLSDPQGTVKRNLAALLPDTPNHLFPPFPHGDEEIHVAVHIAVCLKQAGLPVDPATIPETADSRPLFEHPMVSGRKRKVVLHPGSGSGKKNHPPDFWLELIRRIRKDVFSNRERLILLLGPAEEHLYKFFSSSLEDRETEVILSPEKETLVSLLSQAILYLGHDSGITHLAAMIGAPVIALFRNSSVRQWRPLGPSVKVLVKESSYSILLERIVKEGEGLIRGL